MGTPQPDSARALFALDDPNAPGAEVDALLSAIELRAGLDGSTDPATRVATRTRAGTSGSEDDA